MAGSNCVDMSHSVAVPEFNRGAPRVSVIIIFLDAAAFIAEAIDSVLAQTYGDWELLLVDDGSTDVSSAIARRYAAADPARVRYLEHSGHRNRGMSASRNAGIAAARGEFVAFLDADDVYLPASLERRVALLEGHPTAAIVCGPTLYWHSWTREPGEQGRDRRDFPPRGRAAADRLLPPPSFLVRFLREGRWVPCICSIMVRREAIAAVGGFEERFPGLYEDQAFYAKLGVRAAVLVTDACLAKYRQHPDSACAVARESGGQARAEADFLAWLERYLRRCGAADQAVWRAIRLAQWRNRHPRTAAALRAARRQPSSLIRLPRQAAQAFLRDVARRVPLPRRGGGRPPAVGHVRLGDLGRVTPISRRFGFDRGRPIDRYYIEGFLERHADAIRGRVLEVGDDTYTRRFGAGRVIARDILHVAPGYPGATIVADLADADHLPPDTFDCIILTQTLHLIYDVRAALRTLHRILRPGGVLLATFPGISQIDRGKWAEQWYWSFTARSARRLFGEVFPGEGVVVEAHGNVLAAIAYLHGLATEEVRREDLDQRDPQYEVLVAVRAVKAGEPSC